jgi:sugar lactone lactonase YvrE
MHFDSKEKFMKTTIGKCLLGLSAAVLLSLTASLALAQFPQNPSFSTHIFTSASIEGLTGDKSGKLYTTGRPTGGVACPVWKLDPATPLSPPVQIGSIPAGCNASGIALDKNENIYIADSALGGVIWRLTASDMNPTTPFVTGVPGTNGLAFDKGGFLWTGDGTSGRGRVWKIGTSGGKCEDPATPYQGCQEVFRIQPMRNGTALGGLVSVIATATQPTQGVGRQARTFPHTVDNGNPQDLVANGVAFDLLGNLFVADTARGAIWKVEFNNNGSLRSKTGCDDTFTQNTLCLENIFIAHPLLDGVDGIALDIFGNIWGSINERNAIVVVTSLLRGVIEVFRNPLDQATLLLNGGPLEFPTSPFLLGRKFCTANSDGNRRDNFPNSGGDIPTVGAGKVSCMDQQLIIPGLPLPVH